MPSGRRRPLALSLCGISVLRLPLVQAVAGVLCLFPPVIPASLFRFAPASGPALGPAFPFSISLRLSL